MQKCLTGRQTQINYWVRPSKYRERYTMQTADNTRLKGLQIAAVVCNVFISIIAAIYEKLSESLVMVPLCLCAALCHLQPAAFKFMCTKWCVSISELLPVSGICLLFTKSMQDSAEVGWQRSRAADQTVVSAMEFVRCSSRREDSRAFEMLRNEP